ncbi:MAG: hypothetical protein QNL04_06975 [SAR324 cluster bacterium]|nr:hypothetical protein [SAR324 cluster bacterium]
MLEELKIASQSYVSIARQYDELVDECASLEFIAINAGIASKQANNDSFLKLSSEIQIMSLEATESANKGREQAFVCLDETTQAYGTLLTMLRFNPLFVRAKQQQDLMADYVDIVEQRILNFDIGVLKRNTTQMSRALDNLVQLVNIGKTMAIGGKIKAVYIAGSEEKFRIITETMQESIERLFVLLESISVEFGVIRSLFSNVRAEEI